MQTALLASSFLLCLISPARAEMFIGTAAHLWDKDRKTIDTQLEAAAAAGFTVIRWDAPWRGVELEKDKLVIPKTWDYIVDRSRTLGLQSLIILDYGNKFYDNGDKPLTPEARAGYVRYAKTVASHFAGRVPYFEIWNEWDSGTGQTSHGKLSGYLDLIRATYPVLKAASPDSKVIIGALSAGAYVSLFRPIDKRPARTMFADLLNSDAYKYGDMLSVHPYPHIPRFRSAQRMAATRDNLTTIKTLVDQYPHWKDKPLLISELGWSTDPAHERGTSLHEQRDLTVQALSSANRNGYDGYIAYELWDQDTRGAFQENFGLYRRDASEKPALEAIRAFIQKRKAP